MPKSNYINTICKLYNPDQEKVKRLDFDIGNDDVLKYQKMFNKLKLRKEIVSNNNLIQKLNGNTSSFPNALPEISNRKENMVKIVNIELEKKYEQKINRLNEHLKQYKTEKNKIKYQINKLIKEIDDLKIEIEVLDNYINITDGLNTNSDLKRFEMMKYRKQNTGDREKMFILATQIKKEHEERVQASVKSKSLIQEKKSELEELRKSYQETKSIYSEVRDELANIKTKLLKHYHELLKEGKDTRHSGLIWIIKAIWNTGNNVSISFLPTFLDELAINYLFSMAHKDFEIEAKRKEVEEAKNQLKALLHINTFKRKHKYNLFATQIEVNV